MKVNDNVKVKFRTTDDFIVEGDKERLMFVPSSLLLTYFKSTKQGTMQCEVSVLSLKPYLKVC